MNVFFHVQIIEEIKAYARCREHKKEAQYLKLLEKESLLYSKRSYKPSHKIHHSINNNQILTKC
jgi:hypothetical protein